MNIVLVPICTCKNNQRMQRHNTSTFLFAWCHRSIVVMSQCCVRKDHPWWKWQNEWSMFFCEIVCSGHKISWCDLSMIFIRDFVTHEKHWQITSHVIKKSLFMVTHALFHSSHYPQILTIELYVWHKQTVLRYSPYPWWPYCGNLINAVPSLNFKVNCPISITEHRK